MTTPFEPTATTITTTPKRPATLSRHLPAVGVVALLILSLVAPYYFYPFLLMKLMCMALMAASFNLLFGYGGMLSFGHAAFIGIGAYAVAILTSYGVNDLGVQLATALAVAGLFALVTGAISLRTRGVYFIMISLAFGQMLFFLATSLAAYGGDDGYTLPSRSLVFGQAVLKNETVLYYVVFGFMAAAYLLLRAFVGPRFVRLVRRISENPIRMLAIGLAPYRYQLTA